MKDSRFAIILWTLSNPISLSAQGLKSTSALTVPDNAQLSNPVMSGELGQPIEHRLTTDMSEFREATYKLVETTIRPDVSVTKIGLVTDRSRLFEFSPYSGHFKVEIEGIDSAGKRVKGIITFLGWAPGYTVFGGRRTHHEFIRTDYTDLIPGPDFHKTTTVLKDGKNTETLFNAVHALNGESRGLKLIEYSRPKSCQRLWNRLGR